MRIEMLLSVVARAENVNDRKTAIRKSWTKQEMEERRQIANDSQLRLASLMEIGDRKSRRIAYILELVAC